MSDQPQTFRAVPEALGPGLAWTHMTIPFNVEQTWGSKARVPVVGTLNGAPFRTSIMPRGDGTHYLSVTKAMQAAGKCKPGDTVQVTMEVDRAERTVDVPQALSTALAKDPEVEATFNALACSCRKEFSDWVAGAKRDQTRATRAGKAVDMVRSGLKRLP